MIVAKRSAPRGSVVPNPKRVKVETMSDDESSADSKDDGVRIGRFGNLYHVGSLHVAVLLESTARHPCAEHKQTKRILNRAHPQ